jgi:hypothetical protein
MAGKNLDVSRWSIYFNNSALLRGITYAGGGLVGAVAGEHIKKMGSRCAREKSEGGWYEPADLTTPSSPLISEFTGPCDGKPLTIRVVYSPEVELRGKFKNKEADLAALNAPFTRLPTPSWRRSRNSARGASPTACGGLFCLHLPTPRNG